MVVPVFEGAWGILEMDFLVQIRVHVAISVFFVYTRGHKSLSPIHLTGSNHRFSE
jgi:hypothetical protein